MCYVWYKSTKRHMQKTNLLFIFYVKSCYQEKKALFLKEYKDSYVSG